MNKAALWDKDGTLTPDIPYSVDFTRITLYPDVGESLYRLRKAGFKLVVVLNQAGVAHGKFPEEALDAIWNRLAALLQPFGAEPDAFYYCPHHPMGHVDEYTKACICRKSAPGMLLQVAQEHTIDLADFYVNEPGGMGSAQSGSAPGRFRKFVNLLSAGTSGKQASVGNGFNFLFN